MISFACAHCGLKIKVKEQHAGKTTKCPTCKQPLTVPPLMAPASWIAPQQIDGAESSLAKIGLDGGVTLAHDPGGPKCSALPALKPQRSVGDALAGRKKNLERYVIEGEIARGGMGAVLRAVDGDLRREVAVKYMLDDKDPKKKARFIEEAQINAQLEHPNIAPVYDLGIDAQQRPFLMMKMIKGQSLKDVLDQLRNHPKQGEKQWTLGRLLNVLVNVCNALAFAHARGVIHRDLKPANIMLGDFGEVYAMDWGLAKVLTGDRAAEQTREPAAALAASTHITSGRTNKVATSRQPEADLTQEGEIVGTPVYMAPEQASCNMQAIDQRSDVYALGALLYEMLTLQAPIDKTGGYLAVLIRVMEGEVVPPEQRDPQRAKAGQIPPELSAIAMKALAKEREQRYPTVEAMRRDLERFLEGRSVSAKEDTKGEMIGKFVKRNRGFSAGIVMTMLVLFCSLVFVGQALRDAREANAEYKREQKIRQDQLHDAVPAFLESARMMVLRRDFKGAMTQVDLALVYAPNHSDVRLLRSQLLIADKNFIHAEAELSRYLQLRPEDGDSRKLAELCRRAQKDRDPPLGEIVALLVQQKAPVLAEKLTASNQELLDLYTRQLNEFWPKQFSLYMAQDGRLGLNLRDKPIRDLAPIKGMALNILNLHGTPITDLSPLRGMPLVSLSLFTCFEVRDIAALQGMQLTNLDLYGCQVEDITPLRGMPLTSLSLSSSKVRDLKPLQGMPLTALLLSNTLVEDFAPLQGMKLTTLDLTNNPFISDLTVLHGMPLTKLYLGGCTKVQDLSPLKGMPLTTLHISSPTQVRDLTPLKGMMLTDVRLPDKIEKGIDVLRAMKSLTRINDMPAAEFWKRYDAGEFTK